MGMNNFAENALLSAFELHALAWCQRESGVLHVGQGAVDNQTRPANALVHFSERQDMQVRPIFHH